MKEKVGGLKREELDIYKLFGKSVDKRIDLKKYCKSGNFFGQNIFVVAVSHEIKNEIILTTKK